MAAGACMCTGISPAHPGTGPFKWLLAWLPPGMGDGTTAAQSGTQSARSPQRGTYSPDLLRDPAAQAGASVSPPVKWTLQTLMQPLQRNYEGGNLCRP